MDTITLSKKQYDLLVKKALHYDYLRELLKEDIFVSPPVKKSEAIIEAFAKTGVYNQKFIKSLKKGLERSSYFENENPAASS